MVEYWIEDRKASGDVWPVGPYATREEAERAARELWSRLSVSDRKGRKVAVWTRPDGWDESGDFDDVMCIEEVRI